MDQDRPDKGLTPEELEAQEASSLPDREAMSLLDVNANLDLALDVAAPIDAAVAANANVAAPIDAAVSANVLSPDGDLGRAAAPQDATIVQDLDGEANGDRQPGRRPSGRARPRRREPRRRPSRTDAADPRDATRRRLTTRDGGVSLDGRAGAACQERHEQQGS